MTCQPPPIAAGPPHYAVIPAWLEFSGLPDDLHGVRRHAWSIFRTLVAMDCTRNPEAPGLVETTATQVGLRSGFDGDATLKVATGLRKRGLIRAFIPASPDDQLFYEVAVPLPTPRDTAQITADMTEHLGPVAANAPWRYRVGEHAAQARDEKAHRQAVDLYLQHIGTGLNASVVDELAILADRFPRESLEHAFRAAAQSGERSLRFVFSRLHATRQGLRGPAGPLTAQLEALHQAALAQGADTDDPA